MRKIITEGNNSLLPISIVPGQKLVIELDGEAHNHQKYYDFQRDNVIGKLGLRVLRLKNEELEDMARVKKKICEQLKKKS